MTTDERLHDSGNGIDTAGETQGVPEPGPADARLGAALVGRTGVTEGARPTLPFWSALSERVRRELGSNGVRDALIWPVLIAVLGLYGWFAAGLRQDVDETLVADKSGVDAALQRVAAEKAAMGRQIAEASARIAALEEA
ncbi:MAG: hypothetical protein WAM94_05200, partial [Chromatiaceae bacterium]